MSRGAREGTFDLDQGPAIPKEHFYPSLECVRWYCQAQCVSLLGMVSKISSHSKADLRIKEVLTIQNHRSCGREVFSLSALRISLPRVYLVNVQKTTLILIKLYIHFSISQTGMVLSEGMFFSFNWQQIFLAPKDECFL